MWLDLLLLVFLLFALLELFIITSAFFGFVRTRVPFIRTNPDDIKLLLAVLPLSASDVFVDLGSGNGSVTLAVARGSAAATIGYELARWTHYWAQLQKLLGGYHRSVFHRRNFFRADWGEATVIYAYLYPSLMERVEEKFRRDCRAGTLLVARDFPLPHLQPERIVATGGQRYSLVNGPVRTKRQRFWSLLLSFLPSKKSLRHEFYIYRLVDK
ncbi:MAG TPA: hypothetical protein VHA30_00305 [Patescibacteria group bacterium]|nr:hypothetical protein [Patescibacteria group bacterium]